MIVEFNFFCHEKKGHSNESSSHRDGKKGSVASDDFVTSNDLQDRIDKYGFIQ